MIEAKKRLLTPLTDKKKQAAGPVYRTGSL